MFTEQGAVKPPQEAFSSYGLLSGNIWRNIGCFRSVDCTCTPWVAWAGLLSQEFGGMSLATEKGVAAFTSVLSLVGVDRSDVSIGRVLIRKFRERGGVSNAAGR